MEEAEEIGQINYKKNYQIATAQEIVELLSVESLISVVARLIGSWNRVANSTHRSNEELSSFVSRCLRLAAEHRLQAELSTNLQVG